MRAIVFVTGLLLWVLVLIDSFDTLVLPRRTRYALRIARIFYRNTWTAYEAIAKRIQSPIQREAFLSVFGPLSLLMLFGIWILLSIVAFGLMQWSVGMKPQGYAPTLANDLYLSARALATLNDGDPQNRASQWISVTEAGFGLALLGLGISYLPTLYQSFSTRELVIALLDERGGSPPTAGGLLESAPRRPEAVEEQLREWESWAAQLLESQVSFPMLCYFRSHHSNQAWLTALVAIVDCAAVISLAAKEDLQAQAARTFAMGCHVLSDIAVVFGLEKEASRSYPPRVSDENYRELERLTAARKSQLKIETLSLKSLHERCALYEPQAIALSAHFLMTLPPWIPDNAVREDWRTSVLNREETPFAVSDPFKSAD